MPSHSFEIGRSSVRQKQRYSVRQYYYPTLLVLVFLAFVSLAFKKGGVGIHDDIVSKPWRQLVHVPTARSMLGADVAPRQSAVVEASQCRLVRNAKDQCSFVRTNCPDNDDGLFSYLQIYYCTFANAKPLAFVLLIVWLSLLFSTIGIAASDFLCINLSTIAGILGMSESLTGVTFLAFGNGSPDVFSTLAAMKSNSGSLAIGELIGAASFITSIVAGSMALIRPFRVARRSFVRDVGYFVVAASLSMALLADGRINAWESAVMVGLYCFYVGTVVSWHWYRVQKRKVLERDVAARSHFHIPENQELDIDDVPEDDDPEVATESRGLLRRASTENFEDLERSGAPAWEDDEEDDETRNRYLADIRENMHVARPAVARRRNTFNPIRPSLVGALEFQSILSSLMKSRSIQHQNEPVNPREYFDDPNLMPSPRLDSRSVLSTPRISKPWPLDDPSARVRAGSANDAAGLKLDSDLLSRNRKRPALLTVTRPSGEFTDSQDFTNHKPTQTGQSNTLGVSPSSRSQSRGTSPAVPPIQTSNLLAPPQPNSFLTPNYQSDRPHSRSPVGVSPRGASPAMSPHVELGSPVVPFPPYVDEPSSLPSPVPSIRLPTAASPTEFLQVHDRLSEDNRTMAPLWWWPHWILPPPESLLSTFFPSLYGWTAKSVWERILSIFAVPSVLLLTITLPVVEPAPPDAASDSVSVVVTQADGEEGPPPPVRLADGNQFHESRDYTPASRQQVIEPITHETAGRPRLDSELPAFQPQVSDPSEAPQAKEWNWWLISLQLFAGPFFFSLIAWTSTDPEKNPHNLVFPSLCSLLFSLFCYTGLILSTRYGSHYSHPPNGWRPFLALLGFVVAISWIATIATEVVNLLQTLGVILDISDSLLGLTIFAVGNSLGDLVADVTVARLGYPVMALSACFGGPMMNILLGIGMGGLYMTWKSPASTEVKTASIANGGSYEIAISKVLVISGATLLTTLVGLLIVVPLNKWRMDRKIGWGLVVLWTVSTVASVVTEATT